MRKIIKLIALVITMLLLSIIAFADDDISVQINNTPINFNCLHNGQAVVKSQALVNGVIKNIDDQDGVVADTKL